MSRIAPQRRSATALRRAAEGESARTIVIALLANIVIGIAKLIGGLVSGSTGMLAEAAHSAADSVNEIFLAIGLHRDRQPADATHPLGHGRERFLWAFMAAIASFLIGGCVSIGMAMADPPILVECKSYTWTSGGNSPSAKIKGLNEVMLLFSVAPEQYRKILFVLKHLRGNVTLAAHYIKTQGHLIGPNVEIWEFDLDAKRGDRVL